MTTKLRLARGQHGKTGGELSGLRDAKLMAQKDKAEAAFKARVMKDPSLAKKYGDLWDRIAVVADARREVEPATMFRGSSFLSVLSAAISIASPSEVPVPWLSM